MSSLPGLACYVHVMLDDNEGTWESLCLVLRGGSILATLRQAFFFRGGPSRASGALDITPPDAAELMGASSMGLMARDGVHDVTLLDWEPAMASAQAAAMTGAGGCGIASTDARVGMSRVASARTVEVDVPDSMGAIVPKPVNEGMACDIDAISEDLDARPPGNDDMQFNVEPEEGAGSDNGVTCNVDTIEGSSSRNQPIRTPHSAGEISRMSSSSSQAHLTCNGNEHE